MTDPTALSLAALVAGYRTGALDPRQATAAYLDRIARRNPDLNAYIATFDAAARAAAAASAERWRTGRALGPIDGAPVALKDNIDIAGKQTANGCAFGPTPSEDADVARRLEAGGAVLLGKLNQHELAFGATTDNPHWGRCHNPARAGYTPGGSSGGSGAAVAAGLAVATLGTDTMGSVRIPAAYCGVYGLKPSFGLVSPRGVAPLAWSLDHVGPLSRDPADLALMLDAMAGFDGRSPESQAVSLDRRPVALDGLKIGSVAGLADNDIDAEVSAAYAAFLQRLAAAGAEIVEVSWSGLDFGRARRAGLLRAEADAALAYADDLAATPERFSAAVRPLLAYGRDLAAPRLAAADRTIRETRSQVLASFVAADVVALPAAPMPPFPFDAPHPPNQADFAAPANFAGCPALSLPAGTTGDGLPIGMQLLGLIGADYRLIALAEEIGVTS